ncbi:MAG: hypothetical protein AB1601_15685 [Planctomycetota bacterium]
MSNARYSLILGLSLLAAAPVWAAPTTAGARAEAAGLMVVGAPVDPLPAWGTGWSADVMPTWPLSGDPAEARDVLPLPGGPDSSALFLWALGGLGAWQLGRYTRKWHLSALPEWYHTGGPAQVGHAQRLDLERITLDVPLWYDSLGGIQAPAGPVLRRPDLPPRPGSVARPLAAAPRGPPWLSRHR